MRADVKRFGFDHRMRALCVLTRAQWLRGAVDEAADMARYTVSEAEALEHPTTLCLSLISTVFVFLWMGNLSEVEAIAERLISVANKYSLAPYSALALGLSGALAVRRGEATSAIQQLSGCLQTLRSWRHGAQTSVFSSDLAEAMAMAGRIDDAVETIDGAMSEAEGVGGSFDMPEMLRLKGDFLLTRDPSNAAEAEDCFRRSLELAHRQGALSWELRTATALARLRASQGHREEAREELAAVFGRFAEGKETVDLRTAANLLDTLA
jgi:ATP/maltotriose-dependent transcriptional regulator MalT